MCGIAGYLGQPDRSVIERMTRSLVHRGPDDEGYFVNEKVALGMRRLKIIDLEGGKQPMKGGHGATVIFNREIYNFRKLRSDLETVGIRFQTNSDTEAILHGYEHWGTQLFARLDGMFAIAIWDEHTQTLILARDRFGEKPLYYGRFGNSFVFGSELKALLQHPAVKRELDTESLQQYLVYDYVSAPRSIFKNILKLPPASCMIVRDDTQRIESYWNLRLTEKSISLEAAEELLKEKVERAVTSRMQADVPLGVFLSGGLDSSSIAYFASKNSAQKGRTFSIGFEDQSFDESQHARQVAEFLGTDHTEHIFTTKDCLDTVPKIFSVLDEPFADASVLPTFLLAQFTRIHVTVALDGDGSDELFGGYPTFQARKFLWLYRLFPTAIVNSLISRLPTSFDNITFEYGLKRIAEGARYPKLIDEYSWICSFLPHLLSQLLTTAFTTGIQDPFAVLARYIRDAGSVSDFNKMTYLYSKMYLQDDILTKSDRASMMVSLESRAPFLAVELVEFISSLPVKYKMRGLTTKWLLKRVMRPLLPPGIADRKKKGFGVPMARWLTGELKPLMLGLLEPGRLRREGYFNPDFVARLIAEHQANKKDNRKLLWNLMAFQLWKDKWLA